MSIPTLAQAKIYLRETADDLEPAIAIAISGAQAEMDGFIGGYPSSERWPTEGSVPGDVLYAALALTRVHFEEGDAVQAQLWRAAAQGQLIDYRMNTGFGA